jgi:hypothetical protein
MSEKKDFFDAAFRHEFMVLPLAVRRELPFKAGIKSVQDIRLTRSGRRWRRPWGMSTRFFWNVGGNC